MKKLFGFLLVVLVAVGVYFAFRPSQEKLGEQKPSEPIATSVGSLKEGVERVATSVGSENGIESDANIIVTSPKPNASLTSPFIVSGQARVFENVVSVRVTNAKGDAFIQETAYAKAPDVGQFGPFSINLSYQFRNTKEGFVEVYNASPKDGSPENVVKIPVKFE